MKNKVKDIGIKNRLDDIINIKIFDLNNIEILFRSNTYIY